VPQVNPHAFPLQVAVPLAGGVQAWQDVAPQLEVLVLLAHALPQVWKPVLQVNPHAVPSQVATPLAGGAQAVHDVVPQLFTLVLETHAPLHR
jgi:hypothetical protein